MVSCAECLRGTISSGGGRHIDFRNVAATAEIHFRLAGTPTAERTTALRYIALAHIEDGKTPTETALALRVTPRAITRWLKWFIDEGLDRVVGIPHD